MNQMDKEDVLQKFQHQMFHLLQAQHHNAHSAKSQTDKEDACQNLLQVQFHAQLDIWVTEMETALLFHQVFQLFQQIPQVPAHAKELLMNYKLKSML